MRVKHTRIHGIFLTLALTAAALSGCSFKQGAATPTTAAPYADESTAEYERFEEAQLKERERFTRMEEELFRKEVGSCRLNLHFLLKNPESYGLTSVDSLFPALTPEQMAQDNAEREEIKKELESFDLTLLNDDQKLTARILQSLLKTSEKSDGLDLYYQPLAPTIGVQAELPVLLCEYTFYGRQDIEDYLSLLGDLDRYYGEILAFEQKKADAGLMMSDTSIDHVIESCESYLLVPGNNFMIDTFNSRLDDVPELSGEEKADYRARNEAALTQHFVPAYQLLIDGLQKLKGTGVNDRGMCGYPEGKKYYEYLVFSGTGTSYASVDDLLTAIRETINESLEETSALLSEHPELSESFSSYKYRQTEPAAIMEELKELSAADFPELSECSYTFKDVPKALELSLSPAFYLTPPLDDMSDNVVYINHNKVYENQPLYNVIAHEGYPGHLYQTVYQGSHCDSDLRKLMSFPGYSEGWATYVEQLSYTMDNGLDPNLGKLLTANSVAQLGLHAYLDIAVNYLGWEREQVKDFLGQYYDSPEDISDAMFEVMVDTPSNYLSYFVGYIEIRNMREIAEMQLGAKFDAKEFHRFLLDMGEAPFDVIQSYFASWLMEQKL